MTGAERWHAYSVAGRTVLVDRPLAHWPALSTGLSAAVATDTVRLTPNQASQVVFDGPGWLGGVERRVVSRTGESGYQLEVGGIGQFHIALDGRAATCESTDHAATPDQVEEAATGIALVLALALQGVFCLHAGAVRAGGAAIAVLGESGSGKSTLTSWLSGGGNVGWPLLADDVLAVELVDGEAGAAVVRPDYPQPRLSLANQPGATMPPTLRLGGVCVLDTVASAETAPDRTVRPGSDSAGSGSSGSSPAHGVAAGTAPADTDAAAAQTAGGDAAGGDAVVPPVVRADRLKPAEAVHALARNTLALRLFDQQLAADHIGFCADVVRDVSVMSLRYPRVRDALPNVAAVITDELL